MLAVAVILPVVLCGCALTATKTVVVTATPSRPTPAAILSPAAFALTADDVPHGLAEVVSRFHSNEEVAADYHLSPTKIRKLGRITSFETEFQSGQASGMREVDDVVSAWRTAVGARWDYSRVVRQIRHARSREVGVRALRAPGLGTEHIALTFRGIGQPASLVDYAVVFRRGSYRVYLQVVALYGTIADGDVIRLARIIDRRLPRGR